MPVYRGQFRVVPVDVVLDDIRAQVAAGAQHITFGDPDFFNGPTHARRLVERLRTRVSRTHLRRHDQDRASARSTPDMLPVLRDTGCLFVTSAVESIDDDVLEQAAEGTHARRFRARSCALPRRRA